MSPKKISSELTIKFKRLVPEAKIPQYAHPFDAGFDLYSIEEYTLQPGERHTFGTGLASEIPEGWFVMFKGKSGLATKGGIECLAGVIDSGYRGEWGVVLINLGKEAYTIKAGDKVTQGILIPVNQAKMLEVEELSDSDRGGKGFGSTGR